MSFPWKDEHMTIFLDIYRNHECLWNTKSADYHKINIREKAYKSVLNQLNLPELTINDVRAKIKTIRTRYCSVLAKIRKSEKSGTGVDDLYVPRLFWFKQADSFLRDVCVAKDSSSNMQEYLESARQSDTTELATPKTIHETNALDEDLDTEVHNADSQSQDTIDSELIEEATNQVTAKNQVTPSTSRGTKRGPLRNGSKRGTSNTVESIHGAITKLSKLSQENQTQKQLHDFDVFCNSLAIQLKNMPLRQALICQDKLQRVMTQHRLSLLSSETHASPAYIYSSTPSPASTYSDHTARPVYYPDISQNQERSSSILSHAIASSIGEFNQFEN